MMDRMDEGADVVYGQREVRQGETWFKRVTAGLFYRLLERLVEIEIPPGQIRETFGCFPAGQ
jgi:dolichol-phosphate mannosyltransferase